MTKVCFMGRLLQDFNSSTRACLRDQQTRLKQCRENSGMEIQTGTHRLAS